MIIKINTELKKMKNKCSYYNECRNRILEATMCNSQCELYKLLEDRQYPVTFTQSKYQRLINILKRDKT